MRSGRSPQANLDAAAKLIGEAKAAGADYVQTPEMTNIMEVEPRAAVRRHRRRRRTTPASRRSASWRASLSIYLHIGSLAIKVTPDKAANRALPDRPAAARSSRATTRSTCSTSISPTARAIASRATTAPASSPCCTICRGAGSASPICYDLRFPALYRALAEAGASFLAIPSAFTRQTGEAHWHVLIRARAIENGCYVLAAAQGGKHENGRETFGHSLVVDPWGRIVAEGGTEPGVVLAEIDPAEVAAARGARAVAAARPPLRGDRADGGAGASARGAGSGMIRYSLVCERKHEFEIWFKNSADYDKQAKRGLVTCPACGSAKVEKALMAPSLGRGARKGASAPAPEARAEAPRRTAPRRRARRRSR